MTPPDIDDAVADLLAAHPTGRVLLTIAERLDALVERMQLDGDHLDEPKRVEALQADAAAVRRTAGNLSAAGAGRLPAPVRQSHTRVRSA